MSSGALPAAKRDVLAVRRLRITLLTLGSRGDVEPYLGLGVALARGGHQVTVAASAAHESLIRRAGLEAFTVEADPRLKSVNGEPPRWLVPSAIDGAIRLRAAARKPPGLDSIYSGYLEAARSADVVVYSLWLGPVARAMAEIRGCLAIPALLAPIHPTRAFPSPYLPLALHPGVNRVTHRLALRLGRAALHGAPNSWRRRIGLEPAGGDLLLHGEDLCLYGFSRTLVTPPPDWPPGAVITGPWWLDEPRDWRPPDDLRRFLEKPGKVIFLGFGSMMDRRPERLNAIVQAALASLDCRAVLLAGPGEQLALPSGDRWFVVRDIPFDWLFPRVDAIVHHGGAGTTAQAARSGKPSFAVPFFADQGWWGRRIHQAGGGPPPLSRRGLTAAKLASRIQELLHDPHWPEQARRLGTLVRAEAGSTTAVDLITAGWKERIARS